MSRGGLTPSVGVLTVGSLDSFSMDSLQLSGDGAMLDATELVKTKPQNIRVKEFFFAGQIHPKETISSLYRLL